MRILYGIQGTGNGHLARAKALLPQLIQHADVDVLISGKNYTAAFDYPVTYRCKGLSYTFGKDGGINYLDSLKNFQPLHLLNDLTGIPVEDYDLVLSDFEPLTAWASSIKNIRSVSLSHQASFLSPKTPRPALVEKFPELIFKNFAPCDINLGVHYKRYDDFIFPPLIRKSIRSATISHENHITVYLPAFDEKLIMDYLRPLREIKWNIFSRSAKSIKKHDHITICPVSDSGFVESLVSGKGAILASGFQSTSEALFLGKKLLTIPMYGQYEQKCNAAALLEFGASVVEHVDVSFTEHVFHWLGAPAPEPVAYANVTADIIKQILAAADYQPFTDALATPEIL